MNLENKALTDDFAIIVTELACESGVEGGGCYTLATPPPSR
jgi:hypothetical protein